MSSTDNEDGYRLMRNSTSSLRLNVQHYLWKQTCGFNIHPRIPMPADREVKIADIGTGTGIWLADVKLQNPACGIDGFDISLDQCPPIELLPKGCSIRQLNVLEELPTDLKNIYDVVNVRLLQGGLKDDPVPALKSFISMLKPGGYLQWQEVNLSATFISAAKAGLEQSKMEELAQVMHDYDVGKWTPRLAEICAGNGLQDSNTDKYRVPPEISIPFCQTQLGAYEEISRGGMDNSTPSSDGPRFRRLIEQAHAELMKGVWLDHKLEVTVARKSV